MSTPVLAFRGKPKQKPGRGNRSTLEERAALLAIVMPHACDVVESLINDLLADRDEWRFDERGNELPGAVMRR